MFELNSILLVDDDEASHFINKIFIKKLDLKVKVYEVLNGMEALDFLDKVSTSVKMINAFAPCLLVLDIYMPIMDGWQFLDAYLERYPKAIRDKIIIIMMTLSEDDRDIIKAKNNTVIKEYIPKPLTDEKLVEIMEKYFTMNDIPE
ncbi:response regulator [Spongiimicrobium sp. 3-5]|uniref:response regulator n=1 Tax=Spongiimicrobium sp. 3-5 TaxID=3332596 RepID=UPI003980DB1A